jgi:death-on-curing protein
MTLREPIFLTLDQVLILHDRSLREFGGSAGIRDLGQIESAVVAARNNFLYGGGDVFDIAASYAFHIAQSQAFLDGNKRTGVAAALVFLGMNAEYRTPDPLEFHACMEAIAIRRMSKPELAACFRALATAL